MENLALLRSADCALHLQGQSQANTDMPPTLAASCNNLLSALQSSLCSLFGLAVFTPAAVLPCKPACKQSARKSSPTLAAELINMYCCPLKLLNKNELLRESQAQEEERKENKPTRRTYSLLCFRHCLFSYHLLVVYVI